VVDGRLTGERVTSRCDGAYRSPNRASPAEFGIFRRQEQVQTQRVLQSAALPRFGGAAAATEGGEGGNHHLANPSTLTFCASWDVMHCMLLERSSQFAGIAARVARVLCCLLTLSYPYIAHVCNGLCVKFLCDGSRTLNSLTKTV
jgi:hypothetical protein